MTTGVPDSLDRLTQADLIGVVRELIGEVGRLRAENEKLSGALRKLKTEHQAIKDELARLKNLPPRPPQKPSGMDKASDRGGSSFDHRSGGGAKSGGGGKSPRRRGSQLDKLTIDSTVVVRAKAPAGSRLHQASFREAVITAYGGRCALSRLPEPVLLDAAHIVADTDEQLGQPVVPNGLPLSKIHHAAFDAHLIGIDPDYRLHVSERLLGQNDGPMLKALKRLNGGTIHLPNRDRDRPDRDRLALRFERFKAAA